MATNAPLQLSPSTGDSETRRNIERQSPKSRRVRRGLLGIGILCLLLEALPRLEFVDSRFLPPLSVVGARLGAELGQAEFLLATLNTLLAWFLGMSIAMLIAIPLGTLFGLYDVTYRIARTTVDLIRPMPPIALIPLLILVLGQTLEMKVWLVVFAVVWPILFNTISGVREVDPQLLQMSRAFQFSRARQIRRVVLPSAAPFMATGVRISSSIALVVVVTVELIAGGTGGLGAYIAEARAVGTEIPKIFAGTLMTGVLGLILNTVISWTESRLFGWNERRA